MINKIKLSTNFGTWPIARQTPHSSGIWDDCQFFIDDDTTECDWWVVYDGLINPQTAVCDPSHTILITGEPASIKTYSKEFLSQFHTVITSQRNLSHSNIVHKQQALPWMVGMTYLGNKSWSKDFTKNYDELKSISLPLTKTKELSVIISNKAFTQGHRERLEFIHKLKEHFGNRIDIFGRGMQEVPDKWNAIAPYKYHIVLENSSYPDYWTEKLSDAFLADSYPIYYGCPNIHDYFDKNSLTTIDIHKPDEAITLIEKVLSENYFETHHAEIAQARDLVLDQYQLFPMICHTIHDMNLNKPENKTSITIVPEKPKTVSSKDMLKKIVKKLTTPELRKYLTDVKSAVVWYMRGRPVPAPHIIKRNILKNHALQYGCKTFVETGTYMGDTTYAMRNVCTDTYSIEVDRTLYEKAVQRFKPYSHIHIMHGDSGDMLPDILKNIHERTFFWLDGHYSAGVTGKGALNTPIIKELETITQHEVKDHIILIDDARCFTGKDDYPEMKVLREFVTTHFPNHTMTVKNDIIRICTR